MKSVKRISWLFLPILFCTLSVLAAFKVSRVAAIEAEDQPPPAFNHEVGIGITSTTIFTDVTSSAGITATHHGDYIWLTTGQAWGDYDNDGWVDLYVTDNAGPNTLFRNQGDGTFVPSSLSSIVDLANVPSGGAVWADYDNDGWQDLYVLNRGSNVLFRNEQGGGFTDVTMTAGVGDSGMGESAAWGDYDQDGYLDLYVTNLNCDSCPLTSRDGLYHNNGDGTFSDVTVALDVAQVHKLGFAVSFMDYDNDGDPDIYVVVDKDLGNVLWRNDGPGCGLWCFTDVSADSGADIQVAGMGLAVGDYDNDSDLDFYFSDEGPMVLLQNQTSQGTANFLDVSQSAGVGFDSVGWGTIFFDYDNDGWLDLYLATMPPDPNLANRLFHNSGDGTFTDVTNTSGSDSTGPTFGVAYADYDRDGRLDFVIGNRDEGYRLYHNQNDDTHSWLHLKLVGVWPVNRDAVGARAYVTTSDGRTLMQEVKAGSSIGSGNELALHFGLGAATATEVTIVWPDGTSQSYAEPIHNQEWRITYSAPYRLHLPFVR